VSCGLPLSSTRLLDHPICPRQHIRRSRQANLLCGLQVDDEFKLRRLLYGEVAGLSTFENLIDINCRTAEQIGIVRAVAHSFTHTFRLTSNKSPDPPVPARLAESSVRSAGYFSSVTESNSGRPFRSQLISPLTSACQRFLSAKRWRSPLRAIHVPGHVDILESSKELKTKLTRNPQPA
jgi:hypothetical protein